MMDNEINTSFNNSKAGANYDNVKYIKNIMPYNNLFYKTCFHNSLLQIINYYKKDMSILFLNDVIEFKEDADNNDFPLCVSCKEVEPLDKVLNYMGIQMREYSNIDKKQLIFKIKHSINQNKPVIIWIDCYYEPIRNDAYLKKHISHTLLTYGYDDVNKEVYILEHVNYGSTIYSEKKIHYKDLQKCYQSYHENYCHDESSAFFEFDIIDKNITDMPKSKFIINQENNDINRNNLRILTNAIEAFILRLPYIYHISERTIENINKIIYVARFERHRNQLLYLDKDVLFLYADLIMEEWKITRGKMVKCFLGNRPGEKEKQEIVIHLKKIIDLEKIYYEFKSSNS